MVTISVVLILLYFGNSVIFRYIYDTTKCSEFIKFYAERNMVYEIMFFLFCMIGFYNSSGWTKYFLCFLGVMIAGSVIDKVLFKITDYVYTDLLLVAIAICTTFTIRNHARRMEGN